MAESQQFGKYQIIERLAAGGMAEVFKARLDGIGGFHRLFAIKRILPHLSANPDFINMLVEEAKVAGLLNHANIVQILDFGSVDGHCYLAMEYVHGRDLGQFLVKCTEKNITLPVPHAVFIILELLKGLEYAHTRQVLKDGKPVPLNIVHRDISPGNLLISYQGEVKITDFGIAKASVRALQTQSGVIKGRFDYMSPEQASGHPVDSRSDLFSAGVLLYQLLTGRHPFRQSTELSTIEAIRKGHYTPATDINPDIPVVLDQVIALALQVNPEHRYPSATYMKESLDRFFHESGFMFTAQTLARFLRELAPDAPRQQDTDPEILLDPPEPSERSQLLAQATQTNLSTIPIPPRQDLEESTLIRKNPTLGEDGGGQKDWAEVQTVIRPDPRSDSRPPRAEPAPKVIRPAEPRNEAKTRVVYRVPAYIHFVYLVALATLLVMGIVLGVGLATRLGGEPMHINQDPVLQIHAAPGVQVQVNGKILTGTPPYAATVQAGSEAVIRVESVGAAPIEARVVLSANELRVISFSTIPMQPKNK